MFFGKGKSELKKENKELMDQIFELTNELKEKHLADRDTANTNKILGFDIFENQIYHSLVYGNDVLVNSSRGKGATTCALKYCHDLMVKGDNVVVHYVCLTNSIKKYATERFNQLYAGGFKHKSNEIIFSTGFNPKMKFDKHKDYILVVDNIFFFSEDFYQTLNENYDSYNKLVFLNTGKTKSKNELLDEILNKRDFRFHMEHWYDNKHGLIYKEGFPIDTNDFYISNLKKILKSKLTDSIY